MAGEQNTQATQAHEHLQPAPQTSTRATPYAPYAASTQWQAGPALAVTIFISIMTAAIALLGSYLILDQRQLGRAANGTISGLALVPALIGQLAMILGALFAARAKGNGFSETMALSAPAGGLRTYAKWLLLQLVVVGLFTLGSSYLLDHDMTGDVKGMADLFRGPWWPLALLVIGVGAPLSEEFLFRGFLQPALVQTRLGFWGASAVTTTLWTAMHVGYSIIGLSEVFLIGLVFCLMLRRTGSLRVPIAVHAIYNTLVALVLMFAPKSLLGF